MAKKGLIFYASMTGNTEKVALRFKQVFEKYGWQCDILKITKNTDIHNLPYCLDDYDLFCVGSPIVQGLPLTQIFDDHLGVLMPPRLFRGWKGHLDKAGMVTEPYPITESFGPKKGIAFVTYGGARSGPPEALPALNFLELRLEDMKIKCIGKFACPGGSHHGHSKELDTFAHQKGWTIEEAAETMQRYEKNPQDAEFASLSQEERKLLDAVLADRRKKLPPPERLHAWHWDMQNRPSERDLLKAEIFLEEILEDYYGGDIEAAPLAQYLCIA